MCSLLISSAVRWAAVGIHPHSLPERSTCWLHELCYLLGQLWWFQGAGWFSVIEGGWDDVLADVAVGTQWWLGFLQGVLLCANLAFDDESEEMQDVVFEAIKVSANNRGPLLAWKVLGFFFFFWTTLCIILRFLFEEIPSASSKCLITWWALVLYW